MDRILIAAALVAVPLVASAQVPQLVQQEGVLVAEDGQALDGDHNLTFRLYAGAQGGDAAWTETHEDVPIQEGWYSAQLGSVEALTGDILLAAPWFSLQVDDGAELAPRRRVASVPFALVARDLRGGTINAATVSVDGDLVINADGQWVGSPVGLRGPQGIQGERGAQGIQGERGPQGAAGGQGEQGSPDTPQQVRDKLIQADGAGSGVDADLVDGLHAAQFLRADANDVATGEIRFNNAIRPSAGGAATNGLRWLDNAFGGGGDAAWIQWVSEGGENSALRIGVANDADDNIELYSPGQILLNGPNNRNLGFVFRNDPFGGSGDRARITLDRDGGENMTLRLFVRNDANDNIELNASGGVDVVGALRVNGVAVPPTDATFRTQLLRVDGPASGLNADLLDGLNSTQFLRSDANITTGGSLTMGGDLEMGARRIHFKTDGSDDAYIYSESPSGNLSRLVLDVRDDVNNDELRFRFTLCCNNGTRDIFVARSHDVAWNDVTMTVNGRIRMRRNNYYLEIERPRDNLEAGLQLRTGGSVKWWMWIDNDGDSTPSLRFLQSGQGFNDGNPQFRIDPEGDIRVGRDLNVVRNATVGGTLTVNGVRIGGNGNAGVVPPGAILLHEQQADQTLINAGYQALNAKLSTVVSGGNTWRNLANVPRYQGWSTAAVVGGRFYQMGTAGSCVYEYNPSNNSWRQRACHPSGQRYSHSAHAIGNDIYFVGGQGPHRYNHRYTPASNSWSNRAEIIGPGGGVNGRYCARGGIVNGQIYISKGILQNGGTTRNTVAYNPANNQWRVLRDSNEWAREFSAAALGDYVYFVGGNNRFRSPHNYVERYHVPSNTWQQVANLPDNLGNTHSIGGPDGRLYVFNGTHGGGLSCAGGCPNTNYVYDPNSNSWSRIANSPHNAFYSGHAILNGEVILSSGEGSRGARVNAYKLPGKAYWLYKKR